MKRFLLIVLLIAAAYFGYTYHIEIRKFVLEKYDNISESISKKQKEIKRGKISKKVQPRKIKDIKNVTIEMTDSLVAETEDLFSDVRDNLEGEENIVDSSRSQPAINTEEKLESFNKSINDSQHTTLKKSILKLSLLGGLRQDGALSYTKQYEITSEDKTLAEQSISIQKEFDQKTKGKQLSFSELKQYKNEYDQNLKSLATNYGISKEQLDEFLKYVKKIRY